VFGKKGFSFWFHCPACNPDGKPFLLAVSVDINVLINDYFLVMGLL